MNIPSNGNHSTICCIPRRFHRLFRLWKKLRGRDGESVGSYIKMRTPLAPPLPPALPLFGGILRFARSTNRVANPI